MLLGLVATPHLLRQDTWVLDLLGNWNERQTDFGGGNDLKIEHATDGRNRIDFIDTSINQGTPESTALVYDEAGNLIFDGQHYYQYDAWNRLVQINRAELDNEEIVAGLLVKHYTYDAAGRLVRTQSPYPDPETEDGLVRSERFYYDGIRRIVELAIDPVESLMSAQTDPEMSLLASQTVGTQQFTLDGRSTPSTFEAAQMDDEENPEPPPSSRIDREYVWGPGDRGVDELIAQFDPWGALMPVLQDQGGDAIALCDLKGSGGLARVVAQYTYDPYGQVITHEHLVPGHAYLRAGHKGLFVDRLDAGVANWMGEDLPRLVAGADLVVQNRNRVLKPDLGRFLQKDPNASGLVMLDGRHSGTAIRGLVHDIDLESQHRDGANLYAYLGANSWTQSDPLGLFVWGSDVVYIGFELGRVAFNMVDQYAGDQDAMASWAVDWQSPDDLFEEDGIWDEWEDFDGFDFGPVAWTFNPGQLARGARGLYRAGRAGLKLRPGTLFPNYRAARAAARSSGRKLEAHHLIERRHFKHGVMTGSKSQVPTVVLTKKQHRYYTNKLRQEIPYRAGKYRNQKYSKEQVWQAYQRVYADQQQWLDAITPFFQ